MGEMDFTIEAVQRRLDEFRFGWKKDEKLGREYRKLRDAANELWELVHKYEERGDINLDL